MKVFISSLIRGLEPYRDAAARAIRALDHDVIRAEDFPASPNTPQQACLDGVRQSDVVLLVISEHYGVSQPSGRSATHEEYLEARDSKPVISLLHEGVELDAQQQTFADEVRGWAGGTFGAGFRTPEDLAREVTRALHRYELNNARVPAADPVVALDRARALLAPPRGGHGPQGALVVGIEPLEPQALLRPSQLEDAVLHRELKQAVLFGDFALFDASAGTTARLDGDWLILAQEEPLVALDSTGRVKIALSAFAGDRTAHALPAIIQEDISRDIERAFRFAAALLDRCDPTHRVADVVPVVGLIETGYAPWKTLREYEQSPGSMTMRGGQDDVIVHLSPPQRRRAALQHQPRELAEDFTVLLRREMLAFR